LRIIIIIICLLTFLLIYLLANCN